MASSRTLDAFAILFVAMLIVQAIIVYAIVPDYKKGGFTQ